MKAFFGRPILGAVNSALPLKMKTKTIILTIAAFLLCSLFVLGANDHIIISQVLYDPINSDTYGEAVELYNPTSNIIDISNYIIKTSSHDVDATIPSNTFMQPNSYFLLTDTQFDSYKDNQSWSSPDYEESITLANTNSGVSIIFNNQTIDAVGWGNSSIIPQNLFESAPASQVQEGHSLARLTLTDTDNNANDFSDISNPILHNSTSLIQTNQSANETNPTNQTSNESGSMNVSIAVNNTPPKILSYSFSEDALAKDGYQILPQPNSNKTILLSVIVYEKDGLSDLSTLNALFQNTIFPYTTQQINETIFNISFSLKLPYYLEPKNYTVNVTIKDNSDASASIQSQFEYLPLLSLDIDATSLNFNQNITTIIGDLLTTTKDKPTITNTGNTILSLGLSADDFESGANALPASILSYGFSSSGSFPNTMSNDIQVNNIGLNPNQKTPLSFRITIPDSAVKGIYTTKVFVAGVSQ